MDLLKEAVSWQRLPSGVFLWAFSKGRGWKLQSKDTLAPSILSSPGWHCEQCDNLSLCPHTWNVGIPEPCGIGWSWGHWFIDYHIWSQWLRCSMTGHSGLPESIGELSLYIFLPKSFPVTNASVPWEIVSYYEFTSAQLIWTLWSPWKKILKPCLSRKINIFHSRIWVLVSSKTHVET